MGEHLECRALHSRALFRALRSHQAAPATGILLRGASAMAYLRLGAVAELRFAGLEPDDLAR